MPWPPYGHVEFYDLVNLGLSAECPLCGVRKDVHYLVSLRFSEEECHARLSRWALDCPAGKVAEGVPIDWDAMRLAHRKQAGLLCKNYASDAAASSA